MLRALTGVGHAEIDADDGDRCAANREWRRLEAEFAQVRRTRDRGNKGPKEQGTTQHKGASEQGSSEAGVRNGRVRARTCCRRLSWMGMWCCLSSRRQKPGAQPQPPLRATAGKAVYEGTGEWLHLTMSPRVVNGGLELTADKVDVSRQSGDAFAHGNVKATWADRRPTGAARRRQSPAMRNRRGVTLGGKGPAHVIAAEAQLNESTGEATFRGHARLWQQANSVSGPVIVLNQHLQTLVARSSDPAEPVRVVMLSAGRVPATAARKLGCRTKAGTRAKPAPAASVIRVRGGRTEVLRCGAQGGDAWRRAGRGDCGDGNGDVVVRYG